MSEVIRHYSYNKVMGPDRVTEEGMRKRDREETIRMSNFIRGWSN